MNKAKKLLSLGLSTVFLNVSVIDANGVKLKPEPHLERDTQKGDDPNEEKTVISYGKDLPSIKEQVDEHNKMCEKGCEIEYWGGFGPEEFFQRLQYLLNPVAFQRSSGCSLNLFNAYATNKWEDKKVELWSIDKVRRQMNSGQDSDIEDEYINEKGRICKDIDLLGIDGHTDRYRSFVGKKKLDGITNNIDINERNLLAFMYKYIQTNRHSYSGINVVYFSSTVRANFIKYFDKTEGNSYISENLYTPFGNLKVKKGSTSKVNKKTLRQVHIYGENDTKEKYYSYDDIGNIFNNLDLENKIKILEIMNEYLSTEESYDLCKKRWEAQVNALSLDAEGKEVFAVLFGIAVLAEPLRECDDGTSQRCVYKTMLYYLKKLKNNEIKLENDNDWEELAKDLESGKHNKQKNLFKFYKRVRERAIETKPKMKKGVEKFFDLCAIESTRGKRKKANKRVRGERKEPKGAGKVRRKEIEKAKKRTEEAVKKQNKREKKQNRQYVINYFFELSASESKK